MAVSFFAQAVEQTEDRPVEQNGAVLATVTDYVTEIATFVADSNITINSTVSLASSAYWMRDQACEISYRL